MEHADQRAELDPVTFDEKKDAVAGVEPGNVSDFQRYSPHRPAEELKRHGHACVPFQDFGRLKFDQCEDDPIGPHRAPFRARANDLADKNQVGSVRHLLKRGWNHRSGLCSAQKKPCNHANNPCCDVQSIGHIYSIWELRTAGTEPLRDR